MPARAFANRQGPLQASVRLPIQQLSALPTSRQAPHLECWPVWLQTLSTLPQGVKPSGRLDLSSGSRCFCLACSRLHSPLEVAYSLSLCLYFTLFCMNITTVSALACVQLFPSARYGDALLTLIAVRRGPWSSGLFPCSSLNMLCCVQSWNSCSLLGVEPPECGLVSDHFR